MVFSMFAGRSKLRVNRQRCMGFWRKGVRGLLVLLCIPLQFSKFLLSEMRVIVKGIEG